MNTCKILVCETLTVILVNLFEVPEVTILESARGEELLEQLELLKLPGFTTTGVAMELIIVAWDRLLGTVRVAF